MLQLAESLACRSYFLRSYSSSAILRGLQNKTSDSHSLTTRRTLSDTHRGRQAFLSRYADRTLTFSEKNAQRRAEIQRVAATLSQSWPEGTSLLQPPGNGTLYPSPNTNAGNVTNMTTNFLMYIPYRVEHQSQTRPDRNQILRNLRVLLLKRSPTASPLPGAWTAISGRLERSDPDNPSSDWETPLNGALREIKEEINADPALFTLESALPPDLVSTPDDQQWRVWPMLWQRQLPRRRHDCSLDEKGDLIGEGAEKVRQLLRRLVRLNSENVGFQWVGIDEMRVLEGVVPGLLETCLRLVEGWIHEERVRYDARDARDADSDSGSGSDV